jgi:hypothetical protein
VELSYEHWSSASKELNQQHCELEIQIAEPDQFSSSLILTVKDNQKSTIKNCFIKGIDGSCYLHQTAENDPSQSIKLEGDDLIISIGFTLLSFNLSTIQLRWKIRPDQAEIFEFYDLEGDILLRGELAIHRIDKKGNIKWSYVGQNIWVNIAGKKEIEIGNNKIKLVDFESNEYWIGFDGKTLKENL